MNAQQLLQEISDYCRQSGLAESTFGRRAVNDGKLAARLRNGGRITTDTLDRIHGFIAAHPPLGHRPTVIERPRETRPVTSLVPSAVASAPPADPQPRPPCRLVLLFHAIPALCSVRGTCVRPETVPPGATPFIGPFPRRLMKSTGFGQQELWI